MALFIAFEGLDGAGKTTQVELLTARLVAQGRRVLQVHEPGGTALGERVRQLVKHEVETALTSEAELLLFAASRAQLVTEVLRPALAAGMVVLADRYVASTFAYQGSGRGLDAAAIADVQRFATGGLEADLTVLLDITPKTGLARKGRPKPSAEAAVQFSLFSDSAADRFEDEAESFALRVREGYLRQANAAMAGGERRWCRVDGAMGVNTVAAAVWRAVEPLLDGSHRDPAHTGQ